MLAKVVEPHNNADGDTSMWIPATGEEALMLRMTNTWTAIASASLATLLVAFSTSSQAAGTTPALTTTGDQVTWAPPIWNNAYYKVVNRVYGPSPAGSPPLAITETTRIAANADEAAADPVFASLDLAQTQAHLRVELATVVASYRAPSQAVGDTSARLTTDLTNYQGTTKSELGSAARAMLDAIAASGTATDAGVAALSTLLTDNLGTLGISMPARPAPTTVGPVFVTDGTVRFDATFNSSVYQAMTRVVVVPEPDLLVADFAKIASGARTEAASSAQPSVFEAYTTLLGLAYTSWNRGYTDRLRNAGQSLFQALSTTAPATVPAAAITDGAAQLLNAAALDGKLADDAAGAALRATLQDALGSLGLPVTLPAPPPVPLPDAIVVKTGDIFVIDSQAGARAYTAAVHAVVDPVKRQVGETQAILDAVPGAVDSVQYTDGMNRGQLRALTLLVSMGLSAEWWNPKSDLSTAGLNLYTLMISGQPATKDQLVKVVADFWSAAIEAGTYASWPAAHLAETTMDTALTTLLVPDPKLPYLTSILGADPARAHALMPATDFGVASPTGGSIRNSVASLDLPAGCVTAPSLISVTTIATTPEVVADQAIGAAWTCTPTVGLKSTDPDALTLLAYLNPSGDRVDYDAATTAADGWEYAQVPHLSNHDDAEPSVLTNLDHVSRLFFAGGAADQPDCAGQATDLAPTTVFGFRTCTALTGQRDVVIAGRWNRSTCVGVHDRNGHALTVTHHSDDSLRLAVIKGMAGIAPGDPILCTNSEVTARVPPDETLDLVITPAIVPTVIVTAANLVLDLAPDRWQNRATVGARLVQDAYRCVVKGGFGLTGSDISSDFEKVMSCIGTILGTDDYRSLSSVDPYSYYVPIEFQGYTADGKPAQKGIFKWIAKGAKFVRALGKALVVIQAAYLRADFENPAYFKVVVKRPPAPTTDAYGRAIPSPCAITWNASARQWSFSQACVDNVYYVPPTQAKAQATPASTPSGYATTILVKRPGTSASFVLDIDGTAHPVPDGGTYLCNKTRMPTRMNMSDAEWATAVRRIGANAACYSWLAPRTLVGGYGGPLDGMVVLNESRTAGWFIQGNQKQPIFPDSIQCLISAPRRLTWDLATSAEVNGGGFPGLGAVVAIGCSNGQPLQAPNNLIIQGGWPVSIQG